MIKNISVIGSTGSIGTQTLDIVRANPDKLRVKALAAGSNVELLLQQAQEFRPEIVSIMDESRYVTLKEALKGEAITVLTGKEGLSAAATMSGVDTVVTSLTGAVGLMPTLEALKNGKNIALANKETLVAAGELVISLANKMGAKILPVDSEHSAIFQALQGNKIQDVENLILTASGGPFRGKNRQDLSKVTVREALNHPNWSMGSKITIDSASLMNKGLEVIEAHWLYGIDYKHIKVLVHPQSIIHSMVEYADGSIMAQLGAPDMRCPIQYALSFPERWENLNIPRADFRTIKNLEFEEPDTETFRALALAYEAGNIGGTMPVVLNAANEVVVQYFLDGKIGFLEIADFVELAMEEHSVIKAPSLEDILEVDSWAREKVKMLIQNHYNKVVMR